MLKDSIATGGAKVAIEFSLFLNFAVVAKSQEA